MFNIKPYKKIIFVYIINLILLICIAYYFNVVYYLLPAKIPLFYSVNWGPAILANKNYLYILFVLSFLISTINLGLSINEQKRGNFNLAKIYGYSTTAINLLLIFFIFRIMQAVILTEPQIPRVFKLIIFPAVFSFLCTMIATPIVIKLAYRFRFIDDPLIHKHPAMLITKPVPRAGGLAFLLGILLPSLLFLPILASQKLIGITIGTALCVITGLIDDRKDLSPFIRLLIQLVAVLVVALAGVILIYIPNPFGGPLKLDDFKIVFNLFGDHKIHYFSVLAAMLWMGWVMNFMSWANGTDGVYAGLISISSVTMAILMFVNLPKDADLLPYTILASLIAGSGLAIGIFTWPPMKIMWGFGATAPAIIIAALSILGSTKVAVTILVLMIPFLDGIFAVIRRLSRGQIPVWGDREHLHHKLLDMGWSKQKIAIFYWLSTLMLALIGLLTTGKTRAVSFISMAFIIAFGISLINILKIKKRF